MNKGRKPVTAESGQETKDPEILSKGKEAREWQRASHLSSHESEANGWPGVQGSVFNWIKSQADYPEGQEV